MPSRDDSLAHFRASHDVNRSEFFKHISIVSVAGLGYVLIESEPADFTWNFPSIVWSVSAVGFLATILCVLGMFRVASAHAEAAYRGLNTDDPALRDRYFAETQKLEKSLKFLGRLMYFAFTVAVISAIIGKINNLLY